MPKFKIKKQDRMPNQNCLGTTGFIVILLTLFLLPLPESFAGGPILGARSTGMGTAFTAVADDPSTIAVNPAGLTQLKGTEVYGGTTFIIPSTEYTSQTGRTEETEFQIFFPPHIYAVSDLKKDTFRFGLGIFSLYGIGGRKWDEDGLTRYSSTESFIATLSLNPAIAWRISPVLSIGAGVNYMLSRTNSKRMVDQSLLGAGDGEIEVEGMGDGWGYNFGILLTPDEKWSLGFAYRSKIRVTHEGDLDLKHIAPALQPVFGGSRFKTDAEMPVTFPEIVSFGIAYKPTKDWIIGFDLEWFGWSSFKNAKLDMDNEIPEANFTDSTALLDWKDILTVKAGAEYKMNEKLALRAGYAYIETQIPDHTLDASAPDGNQHNFSLGVGYRMDTIVLDFFYMAGFFEDRKVKNTILSGEYENFNHYFGFSVGKKF
jgi:long-chain fatty acid transport protein